MISLEINIKMKQQEIGICKCFIIYIIDKKKKKKKKKKVLKILIKWRCNIV